MRSSTLSAALLAWGCAGDARAEGAAPAAEAAAYYAHGSFNSPLRVHLPSEYMADVVRSLAKASGVATIRLKAEGGEVLSLLPRERGGPRLKEVDAAILTAIANTLKVDRPGAESDVLVKTESGGRVPVTVWWERPDALLVEAGAEVRELLPVAWEEGMLAERWQIEELRSCDAPWTPEQLGLIALAFAALSPAEREIVRRVPFRRVERPPAGFEDAAAAYRWDPDEGLRFEFYTLDQDLARTVFLGRPSAPLPWDVWTVLHEFGHAVANAPFQAEVLSLADLIPQIWRLQQRLAPLHERRLDPRDLAAKSELEALYSQWQASLAALEERSYTPERLDALLTAQREVKPAERSLAALVAGRRAPTKYSDTSERELFSEFFAFYHADPDATARVYPDIAAWFGSEAHLRPAE